MKIKKCTELNGTKILQGIAKAVLRGNFIILNVYISKKKKFQINNLSSNLKNLENEEQSKPKES